MTTEALNGHGLFWASVNDVYIFAALCLRVSCFKVKYSYLYRFCLSTFPIFWSRNANSALFVVFIHLWCGPAARAVTDGGRHVFFETIA